MSGINSISGLNKVNVDFRPTIEPNVQKTANANQPQPVQVINLDDEPQPPARNEAKSVVQDLDVLLLNAAGRSIAMDAARNVNTIGRDLVNTGVISEKDMANLESLAKDAAAKLKALDKFSGREIAKALMVDKKSEYGELVWGKGFFGLNSTAKAVKAAVEAQEKLSEELAKFNDRLAGSKGVTPAMQDAFTELQFQCDRRATEIYSIAVRMHDLVQKDVVNRADADPQVVAYLDATFKELMPREAILMHGTAEAIKTMKDLLGPLVAKLASFAADGGKELGAEELATISADMATMKNAIENVRRNGLEIKDGRVAANGGPIAEKGGRTEVDHSILKMMEKVLSEASKHLSKVKKNSALRSREAFLREVRDSLSPEDAPGGAKAMTGNAATNSAVRSLRQTRLELVTTLSKFASGEQDMAQFDATLEPIIAKFKADELSCLEQVLQSLGFDAAASRQAAKTVGGIRLVVAQFKELMTSTDRLMKDDADMSVATGDVRRILLGEKSLSSLVEAKARGFKPGDVNPAADDTNIVDSKTLSSGAAGTTYLLTTKSGEKLVFKPELESRLGLGELSLGMCGAYLDSQKTANLNLATQDTAKAFGCEDVVVKYSVGNHDGKFGVFMEKAKGVAGEYFTKKGTDGGGGIPPAELHKITDPAEQTKIKGTVAQQLNKLMWLDLITGQGDRHWGNYFIHIDKTTHEVTVKGIDNDASFSATRIGLRKFALDKEKTELYEAQLKDVCQKIHGKKWQTEYDRRVKNDPAIVRNGDTLTIDLTKAKSHEVRMAIIHTLGLQSIALPEEIDKEFYDKLMEMDEDLTKKQAYLNSIAPRVSADALKATEARLNEAIAHAKTLNKKGKVYRQPQWQNEDNLKGMTNFKANVTITKSDGSTITPSGNDIECVRDYNERRCPSFFKREFLQRMFVFEQPS